MKTSNKICPKCNESKLLDEYHLDVSSKDDYCVVCKICRKEYKRIYRQKNKEKIYLYNKKYCHKNKKAVQKHQRKYRKINRELIVKGQKKYYQKNRKKILKREKVYRNANKEHRNFINLVWKAKQRKKNIRYRISQNTSALIRGRLKRRLISKKGKSTFSFLPYTIDNLIKHLEQKFTKGMSWDNYGLFGWHIDHIKPDSNFNYKSVEDKEFQECWALDNLQPLWAEDNLSKSNKY